MDMIPVGLHDALARGVPMPLRLRRTTGGKTAVVDAEGRFIGYVTGDQAGRLAAVVDVEIDRDGDRGRGFVRVTIDEMFPTGTLRDLAGLRKRAAARNGRKMTVSNKRKPCRD